MKLKVFVQENCPTCLKLKEELKLIDINYVLKFPNEKNKNEFSKYKILNTPTTILVDNDSNEINRFYGYRESERILKFIEEEI